MDKRRPGFGRSLAPFLGLGFLLSMSLVGPLLPDASSQTSANPSIDNTASNTCLGTSLASVPVSATSATSLALTSSEFNAAIAGNAYRFSGASQERHCDGTLFSIDANFIVTNSTGAGEDVVVSFGVSASDVPINVTSVVSLPASSASSNYNSTYWSGYQFCNNTGGSGCPTTPSTAATASKETFTQPNVYVPTGTGAPNCYGSTACILDIWAGLDTSGMGGAYLLQAGSTAEIYHNTLLGM